MSFEGETAKIIYEMMANSYTAGSEPVLHWYEVVLSDGGHIYLWRDFQIKQRMSAYTERGAEKLMNRFACGYENTFNPTEGGNQESSRSYRCEVMEKYNYYVVPLKV